MNSLVTNLVSVVRERDGRDVSFMIFNIGYVFKFLHLLFSISRSM